MGNLFNDFSSPHWNEPWVRSIDNTYYTQTQWLRRKLCICDTYSNLLQEYNIDIYFERSPTMDSYQEEIDFPAYQEITFWQRKQNSTKFKRLEGDEWVTKPDLCQPEASPLAISNQWIHSSSINNFGV